MTNNELCCSIEQKPVKLYCPHCYSLGKKVDILTVKALVKEGEIINLQAKSDYYYCPDENCNVVYFNNTATPSIFLKNSIKTKIGIKQDSNGYICYCFGFIARDLLENPSHEKIIREQVKIKNCACEVKNIHGSCCLGDVQKVLKKTAFDVSLKSQMPSVSPKI